MDLSANHLSPYIPSTLLGLLGLIFFYLYRYFRHKNNNQLYKLKAIKPQDRQRVMEAMINDLKIPIDTSDLTSNQKYNLIVKGLNSRNRKHLIVAITLIVLSGFITYLIWHDSNDSKKNLETGNKIDSTKTSNNSNSRLQDSQISNPHPTIAPVTEPEHAKINYTNQKKTIEQQSEPTIKNASGLNLDDIVGTYAVYYDILGETVYSFNGKLKIDKDGSNTFKIEGEYSYRIVSKEESAKRPGYDILSTHQATFHAEECTLNASEKWQNIAVRGTYKEDYNYEIKNAAYGMAINLISFDLLNKEIRFKNITIENNDYNYLPQLKARFISWKKN